MAGLLALHNLETPPSRRHEEIQEVFEAEPFRVKFDNWHSVGVYRG
jgi:hypothetical protein